jgi:hypothetical protein
MGAMQSLTLFGKLTPRNITSCNMAPAVAETSPEIFERGSKRPRYWRI